MLRRVTLPLAAPGIAVAAIFAWLDSWNDLLYAIYLFLTEQTLRVNLTQVATSVIVATTVSPQQ